LKEHRRRLSRAFAAGALLTAVLVALIPGTAAGGAGQGPGLQLRVPAVTDHDLLLTGKIELTARSSQRQKVELSVSALNWGGGPLLSPRRTISLPRGETMLSLPLSSEGRELLRACGAKRLTAVAFAVRGHGRGWHTGRRSGPLARASGPLQRTVAQCDALAEANRCETIAAPGSNCLFPWPSDYFTVRDRKTGTGRRVNLALQSTPVNSQGVHLDPAELNRSDGFSPGVSIVTHVPGLDTPQAFERTGAVPLTDMDRSFAPEQPIVLIDAATGRRQLIWSELDANASTPAATNLIIRVGRNLKEGHRYIVALRNLKDAQGNTIAAPPGFEIYRDRLKTGVHVIDRRRPHFERIFTKLRRAGIARGNLYGAWDFTVASEGNIAGRMLKIRNDALAQLGDQSPGDGVMQGHAPSFTVTDVKTVNEPNPSPGHEELTGSHAVQNVREVTGTFQVPCYLDRIGCPSGSRYNLGPDGLPRQLPGNTYTANFTCNIPISAVHEQTPGAGNWVVDHRYRGSMYGHGLFGDAGEVHTTNVRQLGTDEGVVTCATDWIGMAEEDIGPEAVPALLDLSKFPALPDRLQQGFLDFIYLGRLIAMPDGFASAPGFRFGGIPVIDTSKGVFYYGNSQGGIAGGALTAVEPDVTRSVLYVPGMNYSTLLNRSVDFADYALLLYPSYPDESVRPLLFSMIQMEWDRGEPNGYANHMTGDPLPRTPAHHVLIEMAYGDHQVSNVATEVEARTIGAPLRYPTLDPGRTPGFVDFFPDLPRLGDLSGQAALGNGFFVWDIGPKRPDLTTPDPDDVLGTDPAPITNTAPDDSFGVDPHDTVINTSAEIRHQIAEFIKPNGRIIDPCGPLPCYAAGWTGPGS
jgi:hypothetical protein